MKEHQQNMEPPEVMEPYCCRDCDHPDECPLDENKSCPEYNREADIVCLERKLNIQENSKNE